MPTPSQLARLPASAARLQSDWATLCRKIGERRAGSAGERDAGSYIARQFANAGLQIRREPFPCRRLVESKTTVAAQRRGGWLPCPSHVIVNSPPTPGGRPVEGKIAWLELPEGAHRLRRDSLRHKIAIMFGSLPAEPEWHRRLLAARPAAVVVLDDRLPFAWPKSDGLFPHFVKRYGAVPTVSIAYQTAWKWRAEGVTFAKVAVASRHATALSANIVATLPGTEPGLASLLFCAHHDTQPDTIGADDNASGVVCILELARLLARRPGRRRTLHFVSFGCEEQLSVGSAAFVRRHRRVLDRIGLVVNFDAISSVLGHNHLFHSGQKRLAAFFRAELGRGGYDVEIEDAVSPYSDHFPFTAYGVPAVWFHRSNVKGIHRWQHHWVHDSLANVLPAEVSGLIDALLPPALFLAGEADWPFPREAPARLAAEAVHLARALYGMRIAGERAGSISL